MHFHLYRLLLSISINIYNITFERNSTLYSFLWETTHKLRYHSAHPVTRHPWHVTRRIRHATSALWHVTRRIRHATSTLWHVTRRIRHATNYNASIALFKSLGLYFVASKDLSRLLLTLIWQIRPPHSLIFKKIIIITNIPTNINNFRYFMIPIYLTLEYYNTTSIAWLHQRMQYSFNPFTLLKHINWEKFNHLFIVEKPLTNWGTIRHIQSRDPRDMWHGAQSTYHYMRNHSLTEVPLTRLTQHLPTRFHSFSEKLISFLFKYFLIQCYQTTRTTSPKHGLPHLYRKIQCLQSQARSLPRAFMR